MSSFDVSSLTNKLGPASLIVNPSKGVSLPSIYWLQINVGAPLGGSTVLSVSAGGKGTETLTGPGNTPQGSTYYFEMSLNFGFSWANNTYPVFGQVFKSDGSPTFNAYVIGFRSATTSSVVVSISRLDANTAWSEHLLVNLFIISA